LTVSEKGRAAAAWWRALQPDPARRNPRDRPGDRGALARLRRCHHPLDAAAEPAALDLARRLGVRSGGDPALADALAAAVVLAGVRASDPGGPHPARRLGSGERPLMSRLRLARLLAADTPEERLTGFRRAVALAGGAADGAALAEALLDWPGQRVRWAFEYHAAEPPPGPAPAGDDDA
jgi:CRISPR system Cascade subunit CasB